ncbi:MAG: Fur family iron response transcriptional regulator [Gammaproteobacteria bacterium]|jgi:Fur family iron response transcriptional regulator
MNDTQDTIKATLLEFDINPTVQRNEIARVMLSKPQHLSADQVLILVNANDGHVSKATVYNTLNLFVGKGLIREVAIDPTKIFYDSNASHHHHYYNEDTGELYDFEADDMSLNPKSSLPENTVQSGVDVVVRVKNST